LLCTHTNADAIYVQISDWQNLWVRLHEL
jgi:hypothetical protein